MRKRQVTQIVPFTANAALAGLSVDSHPQTMASKIRRAGFKPALAAICFCSLAVSASAQSYAVPQIAPEQGFTIEPKVQTPIVLMTQPDAACDLHADGVSEVPHTMRLYANADGYVRVHVSPKEEFPDDVRFQLDCVSAGQTTTYPLHLRVASYPTADMPAPQASIPAPRGSRVLPALTDQAAQQLSDRDLIGLGYPPRPEATVSPDKYTKWLGLVSQPLTVIPPHSVSRSDISHRLRDVQEGPETSKNWSGYEAQGGKRSYEAVYGFWAVPPITIGELHYLTNSSLWVGLDGDGTSDLVQAGTEQDSYEIVFPYLFTIYYAWTELLPNQSTAQQVGLSINPGDEVSVEVWVGDSDGNINQTGGYAWYSILDSTQEQIVYVMTALSGTYFEGSEAEWIMERPCLGQCSTSTPDYADLSNYIIASMNGAGAAAPKGDWTLSSASGNRQLTMYNEKVNYPDNNLLASAISALPELILFDWYNFH
jgi:hypothetical protein